MTVDSTVRSYCASKDYTATELDTFDAITGQLFAENHMVHPYLDGIERKVSVMDVALEEIVLGNKHHYEDVEARSLTVPAAEVPEIAGVLIQRAGRLYLLDGYHRLKWLRESMCASGTYIVLG